MTTRQLERSWTDERHARFECRETPAWDADSIPRGRCAHIGDGLWLTRCAGCDDAVTHWGAMPYYATMGPHDVEAHGSQVAGINAGMLP